MGDTHGNDTNPESDKPHAPRAQQKEDTAHSGRKRWYKNPVYVVSGCVAGVICAIVVVVAIQSLMLKHAHQNAERAWVKVQDATIVGPLVQHNVPRATILFHNTGRSPALTSNIRLVMTVWTSNKLPDWETPPTLTTEAERVSVIDPGSVVSQALSLMTPLTDEQGIHLERKDWFIVILGAVSYVDIFDNPHETKLCFIWRDTLSEHMSPCEKWNVAD